MIYKLTPLDTLFFRGGQPFNAGETGQMEVAGQFPPSPTSVVGALRAALARAQGWKHNGWTQELKTILGDGEDLGELSFQGPYLLKDDEPVFPVPLHILGKTNHTESKTQETHFSFTRLQPGEKQLTDIGVIQLPQKMSKETGFKPLEFHYLSRVGMEKVLAGHEPDHHDLLEQQILWQTENRVGIQRDHSSKTTKDNALYQTSHVRLAQGVALAMSINGLRDDWHPQSPALLGGEGRQVWIEGVEALSLPVMPELRVVNNKVYYTATLMTPARLTDDGWKQTGGMIQGLVGTVMSACVGKAVLIGGWDSLNKKPRALEPYLPAGSTFFMEAEAHDLSMVEAQHKTHIGEKTAWGYGQILIGRWHV